MSSLLGWAATAVSAGSYLSRQEARLRKIQGAAACLWIIYGVNVDATPVIVANIIVAAIAFCSSFAKRPAWKENVSLCDLCGSGVGRRGEAPDALRDHANVGHSRGEALR